jgi:outer membrane lipoprotein-sorting protein
MINYLAMCRNLPVILLVCLISLPVTGQQDPEAKKILDRFAKKAESSYPFQIGFEYNYESQADNYTETDQGSILIDKNRFCLSLPEMQIFCDGTTYWNYLVENQEVYISDPADNNAEDLFLSNPAGIFTFYNENFKYRLKGELNIMGASVYEIDLYPIDLNKPYHTIKLLIDKVNYQLHSLQTLEKQGVIHTITVREFKPGIKPGVDAFIFKPEDYPDVVVVDTRL